MYAGRELVKEDYEPWEYCVQEEADTLELLRQLHRGRLAQDKGSSAKRRKPVFDPDEDMPRPHPSNFGPGPNGEMGRHDRRWLSWRPPIVGPQQQACI